MGMSTLSLEVTSAESIAAAKIEVDALTGGYLDILVNNAYGPPAQFPSIEHSIDMNRKADATAPFPL
jgi:1-acylglycerone phosphate reductase